MAKKALKDADNNTVITLPVAGTTVKFRPAKGRDLVKLEMLVRNLADQGEVSNIAFMVHIGQHFIVSPEGMTVEDIYDLDPVDTVEVVNTVKNFPFISALQGIG